MNLKESARIRVPASTANLGPGFDSLGMALSLYAWIEMKKSEKTTFHLYGDEMEGIPVDKSNLLYKVAQLVFDEAGVSVPELEISMYSDIPLTRGLGSSASAIVGALACANALIGSPLPDSKLFDMAAGLEQHPDNVGASLFGGFIVSYWDGEHANYIRINPPERLETLVVIPEFQLLTSQARDAVPKQVLLEDAVYNIGRSSLLTAAIATGQFNMIADAMRDRLHQPYRAALVPGMAEILEQASSYGAIGAALSGAGPTLIAFVEQGDARIESLKSYLINTMAKHGITAESMVLQPDLDGVQVIRDYNTKFIEWIRGEVTT